MVNRDDRCAVGRHGGLPAHPVHARRQRASDHEQRGVARGMLGQQIRADRGLSLAQGAGAALCTEEEAHIRA
ncbi:MAG: hypothetical protein ACK56F_25775, partial [bacterium]